MQKYGFDDARPVLERASARETAARVALGTYARALLQQAYGVDPALPRGEPRTDRGTAGHPAARARTSWTRIDADPVRCADPATAKAMVDEINAAKREGDTLGGVVEVRRLRAAAWPRQPRAR